MPNAHRALPVLLRICAAIDQLFVIEVGPFGARLAEDARAAWLATGNKTKPADVEDYVALLAASVAVAPILCAAPLVIAAWGGWLKWRLGGTTAEGWSPLRRLNLLR